MKGVEAAYGSVNLGSNSNTQAVISAKGNVFINPDKNNLQNFSFDKREQTI